jgi:hypothetical protein
MAPILDLMEDALKPLLLLDVDGVLNPYPACPEGFTEHTFFPEEDEPVRLSNIQGEWLRELRGHFALAWASGWGEDANRFLCSHFDLPELHVIEFPRTPFDPSAKVAPIERSTRQLSMYDPASGKWTLISTCFPTHHVILAEDADRTLWVSSGGAGACERKIMRGNALA